MTARTSIVRREDIEYAFWLAFMEDGSIRLTRTQPTVARNERAMSLTLKIPRSIFATPQLRASITIEDPGIPQPQIDVTAATAALRAVVGCDVDLIINPVPQPERISNVE